jgi:hypothetical protein
MSKHFLKTEDGVRLAPLSQLKDFQVSEGYTDVRHWRVESSDAREVGKVHDLLVDLEGMRTRYIVVRLLSSIAASDSDRDVLIPIGAARIAEQNDTVVVPLTAERVSLLPAYDHVSLFRSHESEIRRHFSLGEAAATTTAPTRGFYDNEAFNDQQFFGSRRAASSDVSTPTPAAAASVDPATVRVQVEPEDSVVLRKGEDGRDEIVIKRPTK